MLAFGHFVLPLAAIVALGLLFVGIKLFFLTPGDRVGIEVPSTPPVAVEQNQGIPPTDTPNDMDVPLLAVNTPDAATQNANETPAVNPSTILAGPIGPGSSQPDTNTQATRSETGTSITSRPADATLTPTPNRRVSPNAHWGVQIGAFQKEEGAKTLAEEVRKAGYTASISTAKNSSGTTFHRVRVAAGNNKDDAAKLAVELEKKGYPVLVVSN